MERSPRPTALRQASLVSFAQQAWNEHGEDAFVFEVAEVLSDDSGLLFKREQEYLDTESPKYNIARFANPRARYDPETRRDAILARMVARKKHYVIVPALWDAIHYEESMAFVRLCRSHALECFAMLLKLAKTAKNARVREKADRSARARLHLVPRMVADAPPESLAKAQAIIGSIGAP